MDYTIYLVLMTVCYLVSISEVFNIITNNCLENILSQTGFVQVGQQHIENDIPFKSFNLNNRTVGRHVCRYERAVMKPHQEIQSYCKPNYLSYLRKCEGGSQGYCTEYRIVYELAHRNVEKMVAETEVFFSCCPGWTKTRLLAKGCKKAICAKECQNGGSCIRPNRCLCPPGWTGRLCQTDIDECQEIVNMCDQICINWPGSFRCSCQDGFVINDDGKTCKRMVPDAPEESELIQHYENLNTKVNEIEKQLRVMSDLSSRVRALSEDIEYLKNQTAEHQGKSGSQESALGRLNSLSEQMAIFEERLAECSCN